MVCMMPKPQETEENIGKLDFKICAPESTVKKISQPTGKNICKSFKRRVSKTYKPFRNATIKIIPVKDGKGFE